MSEKELELLVEICQFIYEFSNKLVMYSANKPNLHDWQPHRKFQIYLERARKHPEREALREKKLFIGNTEVNKDYAADHIIQGSYYGLQDPTIAQLLDKLITQSTRDDKTHHKPKNDYPVVLMSWSENKEISSPKLYKIVAAYWKTPVLLKQGKKYFIYGLNNQMWGLTELNTLKLDSISFPNSEDKPLFIDPLNNKNNTDIHPDIYQEIADKKRHTRGRPLTAAEISESLAKNAIKFGIGNCGERSAVTYELFLGLLDETLVSLGKTHWQKLIEKNIRIERLSLPIGHGDHAFVVVNRKQDSSLSDLSTWGTECILVDNWMGDIVHVEKKQSLLKNKSYNPHCFNYINNEAQHIQQLDEAKMGAGYTSRWYEQRSSHNQPYDLFQWQPYYTGDKKTDKKNQSSDFYSFSNCDFNFSLIENAYTSRKGSEADKIAIKALVDYLEKAKNKNDLTRSIYALFLNCDSNKYKLLISFIGKDFINQHLLEKSSIKEYCRVLNAFSCIQDMENFIDTLADRCDLKSFFKKASKEEINYFLDTINSKSRFVHAISRHFGNVYSFDKIFTNILNNLPHEERLLTAKKYLSKIKYSRFTKSVLKTLPVQSRYDFLQENDAVIFKHLDKKTIKLSQILKLISGTLSHEKMFDYIQAHQAAIYERFSDILIYVDPNKRWDFALNLIIEHPEIMQGDKKIDECNYFGLARILENLVEDKRYEFIEALSKKSSCMDKIFKNAKDYAFDYFETVAKVLPEKNRCAFISSYCQKYSTLLQEKSFISAKYKWSKERLTSLLILLPSSERFDFINQLPYFSNSDFLKFIKSKEILARFEAPDQDKICHALEKAQEMQKQYDLKKNLMTNSLFSTDMAGLFNPSILKKPNTLHSLGFHFSLPLQSNSPSGNVILTVGKLTLKIIKKTFTHLQVEIDGKEVTELTCFLTSETEKQLLQLTGDRKSILEFLTNRNAPPLNQVVKFVQEHMNRQLVL